MKLAMYIKTVKKFMNQAILAGKDYYLNSLCNMLDSHSSVLTFPSLFI